MEHTSSADGTPIAFEKTGHGPALVLVVGAFCTRHTTTTLAAALQDTYTVYAFDRRGRGDSGDTAPYAIEREVEDLAAVVRATGETPYVFGHSSGAALALEAAAAGVPMRKLAVYEPPYAGDPNATAFADEITELVAAGRAEVAAERFLANTGMPAQALAHVTSGPGWPAMVAVAPTLPYDLRLCNGGIVPADRLAKIDCPVLAMAGGASFPWASAAMTEIVAAVPAGEARIVEGQGHGVPDDILVPILHSFFTV